MEAKTFDTIPQAIDSMRRTQAALDASLMDWQRRPQAGDFYFSFFVPGHEGPMAPFVDQPLDDLLRAGAIWIYGQLLKLGDDEPAIKPTRMLVRAYSKIVPDGEVSTTHRTLMWAQLEPTAFHWVRALGWPRLQLRPIVDAAVGNHGWASADVLAAGYVGEIE